VIEIESPGGALQEQAGLVTDETCLEVCESAAEGRHLQVSYTEDDRRVVAIGFEGAGERVCRYRHACLL
jgi:hypothetical protein